jgi:predicted dehydrogenase
VERRRARLFVNYANRASQLDIATHYVLQAGLLGRPVYGETHLDDNISVPTQLWGERTRAWATGSSTAHFLLSHVVDLLRWYFAPAEVAEVYAISQQQVLGYTPDLYDAFLTFDSGLRIRAKAEWIKHIDELVEFEMTYSGEAGTLIYRKRTGFGATPGWRANLSTMLDAPALLGHQQALLDLGANVAARLSRPQPSMGALATDAAGLRPALEYVGLPEDDPEALVGQFIAAILEGKEEPASWRGNGPLPNHLDGLQQTRVVAGIIASATQGVPVRIEH